MIPGELFPAAGEIEINAGRPTATLTVANTGDRPIQVGSHYHFYETNAALAAPKLKAQLANFGAIVMTSSPADFGKFIASEIDKWAKVVRFANLKPE